MPRSMLKENYEITIKKEVRKEITKKKKKKREIDVIKKNNIWELVDSPQNKDVGVKWIYEVKYNTNS